MNRRDFLLKTASWILFNYLGLNYFSKALAFQKQQDNGSSNSPRIALIIDDIGYSIRRAKLFLDLQIPLTFSILPRLAYSYHLAVEIYRSGHEIMLHQPMEPANAKLDPGPGALYTGYAYESITRIIKENIDSVPFAGGVNNHMGSHFTACPREMCATLSIIKTSGLFFIDSLTSNRSVAYQIARRFQMPADARNIFLDNHPYEPLIFSQLKKLKRCAKKCGSAIAIGHPLPQTAKALKRFSRDLTNSGISLVSVSDVLQS
jgi:polysaccharide deacetylase 2 family uncharacterized protein YibQ